MRYVVAADAHHDFQDLDAGRLLGKRRVQAGAALLNRRKVKRGRVGNRLDVSGGFEIVVGSGDTRKLSAGQLRDRLFERSAEIGISRAAITDVPTRVNAELHEIGQPSDLLCAGGLAAGKCAKRIQVHWLPTFGYQVCVQEGRVALLVQSIAGNILGAIAVEILQRKLVRILMSHSSSSELRVLLPEIRFDQLRRRQKFENRGFSPRKGGSSKRGHAACQ